MRVKDVLGRHGEQLAVRHLQADGCTVLDRNWRCREGELDIVAEEGATLVFCEVKTRRGEGFGGPLAAVTPAKARRLRTLALRWLAEHRPGAVELRFDVIAVLVPRDAPARVEHLRGVG